MKSIKKEIEILRGLKNDYVINYLDSFDLMVNGYKICHLVTNFYEVKSYFLQQIYFEN